MLSILCLFINLTREKGGRIQKDILYFFVIHSFMKTKSETNRPDERKIHTGNCDLISKWTSLANVEDDGDDLKVNDRDDDQVRNTFRQFI